MGAKYERRRRRRRLIVVALIAAVVSLIAYVTAPASPKEPDRYPCDALFAEHDARDPLFLFYAAHVGHYPLQVGADCDCDCDYHCCAMRCDATQRNATRCYISATASASPLIIR